ncbi:Uncharacterised protein [Mycobacteroides abscessus subsp. bolletii]|uniref:hypothetical protein n=1 Tax=Mycobacteroides abscessus TaxID=36809 RepID=UPI0009A6B9C7|nr:hypothetical protein [Mycobacteroides abscessus]SKY98714.1 Uncharacterised protein [Mycobacteroides abscessus subsp. bolletii]
MDTVTLISTVLTVAGIIAVIVSVCLAADQPRRPHAQPMHWPQTAQPMAHPYYHHGAYHHPYYYAPHPPRPVTHFYAAPIAPPPVPIAARHQPAPAAQAVIDEPAHDVDARPFVDVTDYTVTYD